MRPYHDFLRGHILFHLENPDPVQRGAISNPIHINPNIRPDWTPKSGSSTPLNCFTIMKPLIGRGTRLAQAFRNFFRKAGLQGSDASWYIYIPNLKILVYFVLGI